MNWRTVSCRGYEVSQISCVHTCMCFMYGYVHEHTRIHTLTKRHIRVSIHVYTEIHKLAAPGTQTRLGGFCMDIYNKCVHTSTHIKIRNWQPLVRRKDSRIFHGCRLLIHVYTYMYTYKHTYQSTTLGTHGTQRNFS
jgi:hypothetical protein